MIITTTAVISSAGAIRLVRKEARPKKGEIVATLVLDVPDCAFQPPALTLRASVAAPKPEQVTPAIRTGKDAALPEDAAGEPWTAARVRRVQSLAGLDDDTFARQLGVSLSILSAWKTATRPLKLAAADEVRLAALEAETKGVTA